MRPDRESLTENPPPPPGPSSAGSTGRVSVPGGRRGCGRSQHAAQPGAGRDRFDRPRGRRGTLCPASGRPRATGRSLDGGPSPMCWPWRSSTSVGRSLWRSRRSWRSPPIRRLAARPGCPAPDPGGIPRLEPAVSTARTVGGQAGSRTWRHCWPRPVACGSRCNVRPVPSSLGEGVPLTRSSVTRRAVEILRRSGDGAVSATGNASFAESVSAPPLEVSPVGVDREATNVVMARRSAVEDLDTEAVAERRAVLTGKSWAAADRHAV